MKKRFIKSIASVLSVIVLCSFVAPTAAFAWGHHHHRRHHHHSKAWWVVPALIGVGVAIHNNSQKSRTETVHIREVEDYNYSETSDYDTFKSNFIRSLDNSELKIYYSLQNLPPNKEGRSYKRYCKKDVDKRRLEKITTNLYEDYEFLRVQGDYVYFKKL